MRLNVGVKLVVAAGFVAMLNAPAARSQNPAPSAPVQTPGAKPIPTMSGGENQVPPTEFPLLPGVGPADTLPRRYIEMWNTGDFRLLSGMFIQFPRLHYPGVSSLAMPLSLVVNRIDTWRNCMPDLKYEILDTIVQGNKVAMRTAYTGTYTRQCFNDVPGPVAGEPLEKIKIEEMLIFGLEQGEIADIWEQYDQLGARLQMGATWCNTTQPAAAESSPEPPPASLSSAPPPPLPSKP
jgi:predicted ester cyclase